MTKATPTVRSLALMRERGYYSVDVTAYHHPASSRKFPRKKDLLGFVDALCFKPHDLTAVQTTTASNIAAHIDKYTNTPVAALVKLWLLADCRIELHGWRPDEDDLRLITAYLDDEGRVVWGEG